MTDHTTKSRLNCGSPIAREPLCPAIMTPDWLFERKKSWTGQSFDALSALKLSVELACENVLHQTGGPFGAVVWDRASEWIVGCGVNMVLASGQSWAHAEMTAIASLEYEIGSYDLSSHDWVLMSSCEPCAMCSCGILWSGIRALHYAAPGSFAAEIGFDEGDKFPDWDERLRARTIEVAGPALGEEARRPFTLYRNAEFPIY